MKGSRKRLARRQVKECKRNEATCKSVTLHVFFQNLLLVQVLHHLHSFHFVSREALFFFPYSALHAVSLTVSGRLKEKCFGQVFSLAFLLVKNTPTSSVESSPVSNPFVSLKLKTIIVYFLGDTTLSLSLVLTSKYQLRHASIFSP